MGKIVKRLEVLGDKGKGKVEVLFDSGATESVVQKSFAEKLATVISLPKWRRFLLADGKTEIKTNLVANIMITINGITIDSRFYVLEKLGREMVIGAATMQEWDIRLNPKEEKITIGVDPNAIELYSFSGCEEIADDG